MELNNVMHERVVELGILIFKNYGANWGQHPYSMAKYEKFKFVLTRSKGSNIFHTCMWEGEIKQHASTWVFPF